VTVAAGCDPARFCHDVTFLRQPADLAAELRAAGCTVRGLPGTLPWSLPALARRLRVARPDVVQTWQFEADVIGRMLSPLTGRVPIVVSLQLPSYDPRVIEVAGWPAASVKRRKAIERFTMRVAKPYFVACSEFVARSARIDLGIPPDRIETIPNAVDLEAVAAGADARTSVRRSLSIADDALLYLNVGRLDPQKNQRRLIEAFAMLESQPEPVLAIAGTGPLERDLRGAAARLGVADRVRFLGPREDVPALLAAADVFAFPSLFEGLGVALLEAMGAGLSCVVSQAEAFDDLITDSVTGLRVAADVTGAIHAALAALAEDPELRLRTGEAARAVIRAEYDSSRTLPRWEAVYERAVTASFG